jgi:hypothetical protein
MAVARRKPTQDPLHDLAVEIESCHQDAVKMAAVTIGHGLRCGELLIGAKGLVKHGEWLQWIEANTTMGVRQAQKYMRLYSRRAEIEAGKCEPGTYLPINDALALIASKEPQEPKIDPNRPFNGLTAVEWIDQGMPDSGLVPPDEDWQEVHTACGMPTGHKINVAAKPDKITRKTLPDGTTEESHHYYPKDDDDDEGDEPRPKPMTKRQMEAYFEEREEATRQLWVAEGRDIKDYEAGIDHQDSAVWEWRKAWGRAAVEEEREAWLRDHPGNPLPEHLCGLSDAEGAEYEKWSAQREASGERTLVLKDEQHLKHLKAAWDAATPDARQKFLEHLRTPAQHD